MALVDCPECDWKFSQYAQSCPKCGFPNPLSNYPATGNNKALVEREEKEIQAYKSPSAPRQFNSPQPEEVQQVIVQPRAEIRTVQESPQQEEEGDPGRFDNSITGFFYGRSHFWFALCVHYLGVLAVLAVAVVALGEPLFMVFIFSGYAFVGLFVLLWNTKNLSHDTAKWAARALIVLFLLLWLGYTPIQ